MTGTIALGPLMLPTALLLAFAAFFVAGSAGRRAGRAGGIDVEPQLWRIVLAALAASRLAFVVQYSNAYLQEPLRILDLRDGGWNLYVGLGVGVAYLGVLAVARRPLRKPLAAAAGAAAAVWLTGALVLATDTREEVRLPQLTLLDLERQPVALATFTGKPTVVNLWATWCPPCRREMPVLQQAQAARPDLNFVFLNQGEAAGQVQAYLAAGKLPLRNVLLDVRGEAGAALGHRALPTTLFFDPFGRLVDTRVGELSQASLAARLQALISFSTLNDD